MSIDMSVETSVIIAAHVLVGTIRRFTAAEVRNGGERDNLLKENQFTALQKAHLIFLYPQGRPWFFSLDRAKKFAALLVEELREAGGCVDENCPIIEIGTDRVYHLSEEGTRIEESPKSSETIVYGSPDFDPETATEDDDGRWDPLTWVK